MTVIERLESEVRSYCRNFPTTFTRAEGSLMWDREGRRYIDFFAGAGALNYGHNEPRLRDALIEYIAGNGITHSLDMTTEAKKGFLEALDTRLLKPRGLDYKVMFPGPTGTNAVESALKLARKVTGRLQIVAFTNAFHGMTLGSLATTGNSMKRQGAGVPLAFTTRVPYCNYEQDLDSLGYVEQLLADGSSGIEAPAAFIVETVQAEGGVRVATDRWLRGLADLAKRHGSLLIVDDIQVGCGRTGPFFSWEKAGITPDIVCLSKSLSGYGLPFSLVLMRPGLDQWEPGEHNGTFRGNNHAFVTGRRALDLFWADDALTTEVDRKAAHAKERLGALASRHGGALRGRGLIQGVAFDDDPELAGAISHEAFERGVIIETAGAEGEVLKLLCALTTPMDLLDEGLDVLDAAAAAAQGKRTGPGANGHAARTTAEGMEVWL